MFNTYLLPDKSFRYNEVFNKNKNNHVKTWISVVKLLEKISPEHNTRPREVIFKQARTAPI